MMKVIILVIMVMRMALLPNVGHADKIASRKQAWPPVRSHHTGKIVSINGTGTMVSNKSSNTPASVTLTNKPFAGVTLITRDDWLAKEYFGYLCGKSDHWILSIS